MEQQHRGESADPKSRSKGLEQVLALLSRSAPFVKSATTTTEDHHDQL